MDIDPQFKQLKQFSSGDALTRGVSQLEGNVAASFKRVATQAVPLLRPTNVKTSDYAAQLDEMVIVDTSSGATVTITMPVTTPDNRGRYVGIVRKSAAGDVILVSQSDIDGAGTSLPLPLSEGLYLFCSQGV